MNKKAFLGTLMAIVFITVAAVGFYIFFYQYYTYDEGVSFETLKDGAYLKEVDDLDLMLISFLRTKEDGFTMLEHIRTGNHDFVRGKAVEVFSILCQGKQDCWWELSADDFNFNANGPSNSEGYSPLQREAELKIPVLEGDMIVDKKIKLLLYG